MDWASLFGFSQPVLETIVRGSAVYWFLFLLFRLVIHRDVGAIAIADVLVLVIIADAAQNAMAGDYRSISDGFVLIGTIVFWNFLTDWLSYRFPRFSRFAEPPLLLLVKNGRMVRGNMRRELMSEDELRAKLREQGIDDLSRVKEAFMERDGQVSVIEKD